jgi:tetratricopeptide (TPR) repeat protein
LGHHEAAEILLGIAVDVNPRGFKSWYGLAYSAYALKKYPRALTAAEKAVELNAYWPESMFILGAALRHNNRFPEAEKALIKARDLSSDTIPQVHWDLALLYANDMQRFGDAARELKLFLKAQPNARDSEKIRALIVEFESKAKNKASK